LEYKYKHELHANEVEILPYYIANLNIEFTYKQKMGNYAEFENLCFVDTLDNYVNMNEGAEMDIFSVTDENAVRIKRQNERKISVIIGNPPYNANQMNENENNKNREYPTIDKRIKDTYIKHSTAQKTKVYDMYARFLRWASDRIDENGVIAFVSNSSFINSRTYDGFRKVVKDEFNYLYMINLKGNARTSGERRRQEGGNVFHDQIRVGIAIYFLIKIKGETGFQAFYNEVRDYAKSEEKLDYIVQNLFQDLPFEHIQPDKDNNWINLVENDWDEMIPLKTNDKGQGIFGFSSLGTSTNRDEWVYDFNADILSEKTAFFIEKYNNLLLTNDMNDTSIKWSDTLKSIFRSKKRLSHDCRKTIKAAFRPFVILNYYSETALSDRLTHNHTVLFDRNLIATNKVIALSGVSSAKQFTVLSSDILTDLHFIGDTQCLPLYRYDKDGDRHENITDWAMAEFRTHYADAAICKEDIFHYVYAVLHDPAYRKKYELNLKRSFPRIPYYEGFGKWAAWGRELMALHIGFDAVDRYPLHRMDLELETVGSPKAKLKADKDHGSIVLDEITSLSGVPSIAWDYKLGNRSALEWVLDQYKEKKPKDPTIAKLFNTYRFADYKEVVIDLLMRVCTVSVKTMAIVEQMESTSQ
jgi:predicted helicase